MITITQEQYNAVKSVAAEIGTTPEELAQLIAFESAFNPTAKNPVSTARGLIQFIDSTAQDLGYSNSLDLVTQNPTVTAQLNNPVREYLKKYAPYPTRQALYMAVFYPAAQYWPSDKQFPDYVAQNNPGINTPADYMKLAASKAQAVQVQGGQTIQPKKNYWPVIAIIASAAAALYFINRS